MTNELELYHGSDANFKEFDATYIKHSNYGWGFSFSTDIDMASSCGDNIYTIELPDDAKLFNMDENDRETEFYQLFVKVLLYNLILIRLVSCKMFREFFCCYLLLNKINIHHLYYYLYYSPLHFRT